MKISLFVFFFLVSVTIDLFAESCGYVNLSNHFGKPYDQQDIGWCYAFSGSDLLTYKYKTVLNGKSISPIHMALLQNLSDAQKVSAESGTVRDAIRFATYRFTEAEPSAFFKGVCLATVDGNIVEPRAKIGLKKQFAQLGLLKAEYDKSISTNNKQAFLDYYAKIFLENPLISKMDVQSLINLMQNSRQSEIGLKYLDLFCPYEGRFKSPENQIALYYHVGGEIITVPPKGPTIYTPIKSSKQILELIHKELDKENVSSISYFSEFLKFNGSSSYRGVSHASTVVGREMIGNSCHIIVRNSWGGCKDKKGEYQYSNNVTKCVDGYLWISEQHLLPHLDGITFLKK